MFNGSNHSCRLRRILTSTGILAIFLVFPALLILTRFVPALRFIPTPLAGLLINNICFLLVIAPRFIHNVRRLSKEQQYGGGDRPRHAGLPVSRSAEELRRGFAERGYRFESSGGYGEKRTPAFLGTTLLYGGVLLAILVGTIDYARQYSTVVLLGVGIPTQLGTSEGLLIGKGFFSYRDVLPQLQVKRQILPNSEWPYGATEIALLSKKNVELASKIITWGGEPLKYGGFEYHMGRFLYDAVLQIGTSSGYIEFDDFIKLQPIWGGESGLYTHSALFKGVRGQWKALYDPKRKALRLGLTKDGAILADGEVIFQKDTRKVIGNFVADITTLGSWSEIHVVRKRHMPLVIFGAVIALIGALLRLIFHPQRVWLEEAPEGCLAWAVGGETKKLVKKDL